MSLIDLEPWAFAPRAHREPGMSARPPVAVRHQLDAGALLEVDALADLADALPARSIEHNLGAVPALLPGGVAPQADLTPGQIVRTLAENGCWMVLKNVEQDPRYATLLEECLREIEPAVTAGDGQTLLREGFIFLSAPGAVTPAHIDPEHNVLLQVRGTKSMLIGRFPDDESLARQSERLHAGKHRNLEQQALDYVEFPLGPGDGVYVPVHAPHTVRNGPAPSVSLSVTWRTRETLRTGLVHGINARLRAHGRAPRAPGGQVWRDEAKAFTQRALLAGDRLRARRGGPS